MAEHFKEDYVGEVAKTLSNEIDSRMNKLREMFNCQEGLNEKLSLQTSDLMEMVNIVESLLLVTEKRFQVITCKLDSIPKHSEDGKNDFEEIMKEFNDMRNEINEIKCLISQKMLYTDQGCSCDQSDGEKKEYLDKNGFEKCKDMYESKETQPLEIILKHLKSIQQYKSSIDHIDSSSKELYKQIMNFLQLENTHSQTAMQDK